MPPAKECDRVSSATAGVGITPADSASGYSRTFDTLSQQAENPWARDPRILAHQNASAQLFSDRLPNRNDRVRNSEGNDPARVRIPSVPKSFISLAPDSNFNRDRARLWNPDQRILNIQLHIFLKGCFACRATSISFVSIVSILSTWLAGPSISIVSGVTTLLVDFKSRTRRSGQPAAECGPAGLRLAQQSA